MGSLILIVLSTLGFAAEGSVSDQVGALLAQRHDPGCAAVLAVGDTTSVRDALVAAAEREAPPWAPMRAASCLTELAATDTAAWTATRELLGREDQPGFAMAIAAKVDVLPEEHAVVVANTVAERVAVQPRLARAVAPTFEMSRHAAVRAVELTAPATPAAP